MNSQLSDAAKFDRHALRRVYERAYSRFLDKLEVTSTPENFPLPYGLCEEARVLQWPQMQFANLIVSGELSETINQLNAWCEWLMHLAVWIEVLDEFDEQDAWAIQHSYVDPLAHVCLTQPSATRDRFGYIATNAIHQANINIVGGYKDKLQQDAQKHPLSRKGLEDQLRNIGKYWTGTPAFIEALHRIDSDAFRRSTGNYRNMASHAIAPRFRIGVTNFVVRQVTAYPELVQQPDRGHLLVDHPTKKSVSYGFRGTEALGLRQVHALSLGEFDNAVTAFTAYSALLREPLAALRARSAESIADTPTALPAPGTI